MDYQTRVKGNYIQLPRRLTSIKFNKAGKCPTFSVVQNLYSQPQYTVIHIVNRYFMKERKHNYALITGAISSECNARYNAC